MLEPDRAADLLQPKGPLCDHVRMSTAVDRSAFRRKAGSASWHGTSLLNFSAVRFPPGTAVTVKGWVRTRRDSKAGLLVPRTCTTAPASTPIQVVAPSDLAQLPERGPAPDHRLLGRSSTASWCASQGKGQAVEIQADVGAGASAGWTIPTPIPIPPKRHTFEYLREVAHLRPRTNTFGAVTRVRNTLAQAVHRFFHERGFFWIHTPIITAQRLRGRGRSMFRVSTLDLANLPRTRERQDRLLAGLLRQARRILTVSGQLNVETYCLALTQGLHLRPDVPRRELATPAAHLAEFWMIEPEIAFADLNADADLAEDVPQVHLPGRARRAAGRHGVLRRAHRQDVHHAPRDVRRIELRADDLHRGDRGPGEVGQEVRVPGEVGHRPAVRARALPDRGARRPARSS